MQCLRLSSDIVRTCPNLSAHAIASPLSNMAVATEEISSSKTRNTECHWLEALYPRSSAVGTALYAFAS
jgi:hypothetical protein